MMRNGIITLGILLLAACGNYVPQQEQAGKLSVVRAANGNLYSTKCLKDGAFNDAEECEVVAGEETAARGAYGDKVKGRIKNFAKEFIIWDLNNFHPDNVCKFFDKLGKQSECEAFLGINQPQSLIYPAPPTYCDPRLMAVQYYQVFQNFQCGNSWQWSPIAQTPWWWYQQYPSYPTYPTQPPAGSDILRLKIKEVSSDKVTGYRISSIPDTNEIAPYKLIKTECVNGICGADTLVTRISQDDMNQIKTRAETARTGQLVQTTNEVQCLAAGPTFTYTANHGATTLYIGSICSNVTKNNTQAAQDLKRFMDIKTGISN